MDETFLAIMKMASLTILSGGSGRIPSKLNELDQTFGEIGHRKFMTCQVISPMGFAIHWGYDQRLILFLKQLKINSNLL